MLEKSSFFNSVNGDRKYKANEFAEYFASFIGNGVFPNPATNLQVIANNDMTVTLKSGKAWINGYFYVNTDNLILRIEPADGVLNRIDRIVLRLDFLNREVRVVVKKGDFATNAAAKILQRDDDAHEIAIADIRVNHGAISITQADITDLRLNTDLCGIVHGTVFQVDPTAIFDQFQSWYSQTKQAYDADIAKWTDDKKKAFDQWYLDNTTAFTQQFNTWYGDNTNKWTNDFTTWFNNIKGQLNGDIAANLAAKAVELESNIKALNGVGEVKEKLNKSEFDNFKKDNESQIADYTKEIDNLKSSVDNGKNSVYSAIVGKGITPANKDFSSLAAGVTAIPKGQGTAVESQVLQGVPFSNSDGKLRTGNMPNRGNVRITPSTSSQTIPNGYHPGQGQVDGDTNLISSNILKGKSIFGVQGNVNSGFDNSPFVNDPLLFLKTPGTPVVINGKITYHSFNMLNSGGEHRTYDSNGTLIATTYITYPGSVYSLSGETFDGKHAVAYIHTSHNSRRDTDYYQIAVYDINNNMVYTSNEVEGGQMYSEEFYYNAYTKKVFALTNYKYIKDIDPNLSTSNEVLLVSDTANQQFNNAVDIFYISIDNYTGYVIFNFPENPDVRDPSMPEASRVIKLYLPSRTIVSTFERNYRNSFVTGGEISAIQILSQRY